MTTSDQEVVAGLGQELVRQIGEPRYNLWFAQHTKFTWDADLLVVGVPNHFFQEWLQKTFEDAVRAAAARVLGRAMRIRFVIDPELFQAARRAQEEVQGAAAADLATVPATSDEVSPAPLAVPAKRSRRWHSLTTFVAGPCNRVAFASALSVIEAPGQGGNPLVLYGSVGTGKSHLLEGIYAGLRGKYPNWRVCFVAAEDFTNRFVQAVRQGKLGSFRKSFREADVLLVDDFQFLAGKQATQEEFLHTFDVLHTEGRQVVLTCDCHPRLSQEFTPPLTDRLLGGAIWGLTTPDADLRLAILRTKASGSDVAIPDPVLRFLAEQLHGNVRELEGALHSLQHYSRVAGRSIDLSLAREALGEHLRHAHRVVQLADVDRAVCQVLKLAEGSLQSKQRAWMVSHPRMLAIFLSRKHTSAAYSEIGQHFGGRNHSTAVAAEKKVRQWLQSDTELAIGETRWRWRDIVELVERELLR